MRLTKRKPKVSMKIEGGPTLEGILLGRSAKHYVLEAASVVVDSGTSHGAGRVCVPVSRVLFFQVL